jgi:16S rRNA (cytidine1402-2'-O)-methyltransferase
MPLSLVPTPIGNLDDVTLRALKVIEDADVILCEDTRVTKKLLTLFKERGLLRATTHQFYALHSHNERAFLSRIQRDFFDRSVVYLSDAGMPGISDPGSTLIRYAQENAIEYDVLPGASASLLAYVASGFESGPFLFYGFLPHKGKERARELETILSSSYDTIVYESPHRLQKLIDAIAQLDPRRELFVLKEATKLYQQQWRGSAKELQHDFAQSTIKGEWVVVIKAVDASNSKLEPSIIEMISTLDISKKEAAELLAKLSGGKKKYWYDYLLEQNKA